MTECTLSNISDEWPKNDDESGDSLFVLDNNSLIKDIRNSKNKNKINLFLDKNIIDEQVVEDEQVGQDDPEEYNNESIEEKILLKKKIRYNDLEKKDKISFIVSQLDKFKNNDNFN